MLPKLESFNMLPDLFLSWALFFSRPRRSHLFRRTQLMSLDPCFTVAKITAACRGMSPAYKMKLTKDDHWLSGELTCQAKPPTATRYFYYFNPNYQKWACGSNHGGQGGRIDGLTSNGTKTGCRRQLERAARELGLKP